MWLMLGVPLYLKVLSPLSFFLGGFFPKPYEEVNLMGLWR